MARQRERGREAQRAAETEAKILALRKQGRAWWIRAVLILVMAAVVGLVLPGALVPGVAGAVVCIGLGLREGMAAQRLEND